ncbi:MAG: ABC-2 family transporter protein, partial [Planctomycetota bacterium]
MSDATGAHRGGGLAASLRIWGTMLAISIEERLVYRGDFALGTLMRFLPIVTQVFLWTAVFSATSRGDIAGYSRNDIVAYYLLTMVSRAFSSMPGLAGGIARSIRDGSIKKFLVQPVDYISFLLASRVAHKLVYYAVAFVPFAAVFWLCRGFFPPAPDAATVAAFLAALLLSFLLGFF